MSKLWHIYTMGNIIIKNKFMDCVDSRLCGLKEASIINNKQSTKMVNAKRFQLHKNKYCLF